MGMAASQARYLALSARKTNTEYEGQQLNQQRLNLSNQSADLFNQMLTMQVPTCPDSTDFTTLQYSWSDGINTSVISDFYRLGTPQEDYNYVVTSYHYEDVYTGSAKKLNDPQVQAFRTNHFTNKPDKDYTITNADYKKESKPGAGDDTYTFTMTRNGIESTRTFRRVATTSNPDEVDAIDSIYSRTVQTAAGGSSNFTKAGDIPKTWDAATTSWKDNAAGAPAAKDQWTFAQTINIKVANSAFDDTKPATDGVADADLPATGRNDRFAAKTINAGTAFTEIDLENPVVVNGVNLKELLTQSYGADFDETDKYFLGLVNPAKPTDGFAFISGKELDSVSKAQGDIANITVRTPDAETYYTDGQYYLSASEIAKLNLDPANLKNTLFFHSTENNPTFSNFTAVGNCELTEISRDDWTDVDQKNMRTELEQVLKDMKGADPVAYANLSKCFDKDTGEYLGGIYKFQMNGKTYYTTTADMERTCEGAYKQDIAENGIDGQFKLKYYNASYIKTKVEEVKNALCETDGTGRFSSVKFEDDSVVYTLSCEAITDDAAYQDAMNKYRYKQEQYDNEVARINAKTEIIQAEDRQLQLRLEQLGTEQTALQTEMEACQKVVSKNVETSFKTFGG